MGTIFAVFSMEGAELRFKGCNFMRQRLAYSILSGRSVIISEIRSDDEEPGIRGQCELFCSLL